MKTDNKMKLIFSSKSYNESFARNAVACFALQLNPSISELSDIKTAVSEAVTNAIVHGYQDEIGDISIEAFINENKLHIIISDNGIGIKNVDEALEPFYTTKAEDERSGMGFTIMKSFMDEFKVESSAQNGTKVYMTKIIKS